VSNGGIPESNSSGSLVSHTPSSGKAPKEPSKFSLTQLPNRLRKSITNIGAAINKEKRLSGIGAIDDESPDGM
jgi:hypothetical protein